MIIVIIGVFSFIYTVWRSFTPSLNVRLFDCFVSHSVRFSLSVSRLNNVGFFFSHSMLCVCDLSISFHGKWSFPYVWLEMSIKYVQVNIHSSILCRHSPIWHVHTYYTLYVSSYMIVLYQAAQKRHRANQRQKQQQQQSNKEKKKKKNRWFFMFVSEYVSHTVLYRNDGSYALFTYRSVDLKSCNGSLRYSFVLFLALCHSPLLQQCK